MTALGGLAAGAAAGAAVAGVITALVGRSQNRRSEEDRVLTLIGKATEEPLAQDRHIMGTAWAQASKRAAAARAPKPAAILLTPDETAALFRMLWYFTDVWALYQAVSRGSKETRRLRLAPTDRWGEASQRLQRLITESLAPAIYTWHGQCIKDPTGGLRQHWTWTPTHRCWNFTDVRASAWALMNLYAELGKAQGGRPTRPPPKKWWQRVRTSATAKRDNAN